MTDTQCKEKADYRYTWPGKDESYCCLKHGTGIRAVANAIGMHIQLIELSEADREENICQSHDG